MLCKVLHSFVWLIHSPEMLTEAVCIYRVYIIYMLVQATLYAHIHSV